MIVTIDGPAGSGKSTAARELAARLGIPYLDTGAMYRAVALRAIEQGLDLQDGQALAKLASQSEFELDFSGRQMRIRLDGRDVTKQVRSMQVTQATPYVARVPEVREVLVRLSGRQMKRGATARGFTEPALLAGLAVLIPMLQLLDHFDLSVLQHLAATVLPPIHASAPLWQDTG